MRLRSRIIEINDQDGGDPSSNATAALSLSLWATARGRIGQNAGGLLFLLMMNGCGTHANVVAGAPGHNGGAAVETYVAVANGLPTISSGAALLTIDHASGRLSVSGPVAGSTDGRSVNAGTFASTTGGFEAASFSLYDGTLNGNQQSDEVGNWVLEIPGVMGLGYISAPMTVNAVGSTSGPHGEGDTSQVVSPFVENMACPDKSVNGTYNFITLPGVLSITDGSSLGNGQGAWNPQTDTAYGSVAVETSGPIVNLTQIKKFLLPGEGVEAGTAVPPMPYLPNDSSTSGACGNTDSGWVTSVTQLFTPVIAGTPGNPAAVVAAIGLTPEFLVEDNGGASINDPSSGVFSVSNVLGGGYGALGLPQQSTAIDIASMMELSFNAFIYEPGAAGANYTATAAFGMPTSNEQDCRNLVQSLSSLHATPSANTVFGGEFPHNNPSTQPTNTCDVAIDLGPQDSSNSGLFTAAKVYIGSKYPFNTAGGKTYSFPAVAIVGTIQKRAVIYVLGADDAHSNLASSVGIYLIQAAK